jgi:hypothetical protein
LLLVLPKDRLEVSSPLDVYIAVLLMTEGKIGFLKLKKKNGGEGGLICTIVNTVNEEM